MFQQFSNIIFLFYYNFLKSQKDAVRKIFLKKYGYERVPIKNNVFSDVPKKS